MSKAIIFDVDGVIFASKDSSGKYLWSKNIKADLGITSIHFKSIFSGTWEEITKGKTDTKEHLANILAKFPELEISVDDFINYWHKNDSFVNKQMLELTSKIQIPIYLGTNQDKYRTQHIDRLIGRYFQRIFSSYEIGYLKPELGFYQHITAALIPSPELISTSSSSAILGAHVPRSTLTPLDACSPSGQSNSGNGISLQPQQIILIDDTEANVKAAREYGWLGYHYQGNIEDLTTFLKENSAI